MTVPGVLLPGDPARPPIEVFVEVVVPRRAEGPAAAWFGTVATRGASDLGPGLFRLALHDGREGEVLIENVRAGRVSVGSFRGCGPLQRRS